MKAVASTRIRAMTRGLSKNEPLSNSTATPSNIAIAQTLSLSLQFAFLGGERLVMNSYKGCLVSTEYILRE